MADESRTVTNTTAGLSVNSDYDVAVDTVAGKDYQRVKLDAGADGAVLPVVAGQQTAANSLPVVLASDQGAVPVSGSVTVSGTATVTTNTEYAEDSLHTTADKGQFVLGVTNENQNSVSAATGDYSPISTNARGGVFVELKRTNQTSDSGSLLKAEDSAHVTGDAGVMLLSVRNTDGANFTDTDLDYNPIATTIKGAVQVNISRTFQDGSDDGALLKREDDPSGGGHSGVVSIAVRRDTPSTTTTLDGDYTNLTTDSSNRLWVNGSGVTQPVSAASLPLPSGAATSAAQTDKSQFTKITDGTDTVEVENAATYSTSIPYTTKGATVNSRAQQIWSPDHPDNDGSGADDAFYGQNQDSNGNLCSNLSSVRGKLLRYRGQVGTTASGTNPPPLWIGGAAATASPTAVTSGRAVDGFWDKVGKQVVSLHTIRELKTKNFITLTSSTTETTLLSAGGSGVFLDITSITFTNTSATVCEVELREATAGSAVHSFEVPPTDSRGITVTDPIIQTTANNNWTAKCITSVASIKIQVNAVQNI
jgi:hypothetical protein